MRLEYSINRAGNGFVVGGICGFIEWIRYGDVYEAVLGSLIFLDPDELSVDLEILISYPCEISCTTAFKSGRSIHETSQTMARELIKNLKKAVLTGRLKPPKSILSRYSSSRSSI